MTKRAKIGQAKHDKKVLQRLSYYKKKEFWTRADLPGGAKPPKVGGKVPDIYARKGDELFVEEIETPSTKKSDKLQQQKLKEGTKKLGGKFKVIMTK